MTQKKYFFKRCLIYIFSLRNRHKKSCRSVANTEMPTHIQSRVDRWLIQRCQPTYKVVSICS